VIAALLVAIASAAVGLITARLAPVSHDPAVRQALPPPRDHRFCRKCGQSLEASDHKQNCAGIAEMLGTMTHEERCLWHTGFGARTAVQLWRERRRAAAEAAVWDNIELPGGKLPG
jgi:hypothetical protein